MARHDLMMGCRGRGTIVKKEQKMKTTIKPRRAGWLLLIALGAFPVVAQPIPGMSTTVRSVARYPADSAEAASIAAWIDRIPGAARQTTPFGMVTVTRTRTIAGQARTENRPRVPLPANGMPGETITIRNTLPGGIVETWTFEWVGGVGGGGWRQTDYESHAPTTLPDKPNEL